MKSCKIPSVTFVTIWQGSVTVQEAATKLQMSPKGAGHRASALRARGVRLKQLKRTPRTPTATVAELNAIIDGA